MKALQRSQRAAGSTIGSLLTGLTRAGIICIALAACGGGDDAALADGGNASASAAAPTAGAASSFQASVSGAVSRTVETGNAFSEAKYGRYHINLASHAEPTMVVAFGRTDTSTPSTGNYPLDDDDWFSGTVEIYSDPQREFDIVSGNLEITDARGDALAGRFSLTAVERSEDGGQREEIKVEGSFQTGKKD